MTPNTDMTERNQPGQGGPQSQQGGGPQGQQGGGPQGQHGAQQGPAAKAASLAANAATKGVEKTRERVVDRVAQQREQISSRVRSLSRALRGAGEMLEENDLAGNALHYASDKVERVAGYVAELSPDRVTEDLRDVARTNPLWFFGGAFTLGLALGRFARSTGEGISEIVEGAQASGESRQGSTGSQARRQPEAQRSQSEQTRTPTEQPRTREPRP